MKTSISERLNGSLESAVSIYGEFIVEVVRADGSVERKVRRNQLTSSGLNRIANRAIQGTGTTPAYVIGVGTITAAASLGSTNFGEVSRKAGVTNAQSTALSGVQSSEWIAVTASWGGNIDSITSVDLESASLLCHANSGIGVVFNIVNGLGVILADSDFLNLTGRIRCGSHNLGHSG